MKNRTFSISAKVKPSCIFVHKPWVIRRKVSKETLVDDFKVENHGDFIFVPLLKGTVNF